MGTELVPWKTVLCHLVGVFIVLETASCSSPGTMAFLDQIKQNYSREIRPNHGGNPVKVTCSLFISTLGAIDTTNMDYSATFYLRKTWQDPRLRFAPSIGVVIFQSEASRNIWVPVISFPGEKSGRIHDLTDENQIIQIWPNGTVVRTMRLTMTLTCHMKSGNFPMDSQKCSLMFESYSFSCLEVVFELHRSLIHFLLQIYLTSTLVVFLSWISFWINPRSEPARVTLGMTSVLTLSTQISGVQSSISDSNFASAIDVWLAICLLFVFAVLVEFAIVSYGYTKLSKHQSNNSCPNNSKGKSFQMELKRMDEMGNDVEDDVVIDMGYQPSHTKNGGTDVKFFSRTKRFFTLTEPGDLDHICRVIFPSVFVIFCGSYWCAYIV